MGSLTYPPGLRNFNFSSVRLRFWYYPRCSHHFWPFGSSSGHVCTFWRSFWSLLSISDQFWLGLAWVCQQRRLRFWYYPRCSYSFWPFGSSSGYFCTFRRSFWSLLLISEEFRPGLAWVGLVVAVVAVAVPNAAAVAVATAMALAVAVAVTSWLGLVCFSWLQLDLAGWLAAVR